MSNLFNFIKPIALTIPGETENLINIGVDKQYADLLWLTPLVGIAMVFAVLTVLWGVLVLFKLIFARPKKEKKVEAPKSEPAPQIVAEPTVVATPVAATDDAELIAILTAAIVAYEAEQNPNAAPCNFRVVSYRRTNGGRSWNAK